jgi:hypothetical protein
MDDILFLFNSLGLIFGPAVFLAGLLALILCFRATRRRKSAPVGRSTVVVSLMPLTISICAALVGLAICIGERRAWNNFDWTALGRCCLAGMVVSLVPLMWSLWLRRSRANVAH